MLDKNNVILRMFCDVFFISTKFHKNFHSEKMVDSLKHKYQLKLSFELLSNDFQN